MTSFVEIVPATHGLLPESCYHCLWWQTSGSAGLARTSPADWTSALCSTWGSTGLVAVNSDHTVASIQFAPAGSLARVTSLPGGSSIPGDQVLLYCLRVRRQTPATDARRVLHRALGLLQLRGAREAYAYARPMGSRDMCSSRNLFGVKFLEANGFQVVNVVDTLHLMKAPVRGLLPVTLEAERLWQRIRHPAAAPSPVAYDRACGE